MPSCRPLSALLVLSMAATGCGTLHRAAELRALGAPACDDVAGVTDIEAARRLGLIAPRLSRTQSDTRAWWGTWLGVLGGGTLLQAGLIAPIHDREWRIDLGVGAVGAFAAALPLALTPRRGLDAYDRLQQALREDAAPHARLCAAERLLAATAADAADKVGWMPHVIGDGAAVALGLVQWLAFGHLRAGLTTAIGGVLGNELLVATQATQAIDDYYDYQLFVAGMRAPPLGAAVTLAF